MGNCKAKNRRGKKCGGYAGADGYCFQHSPGRAAQRAAAHKLGGRLRHGGDSTTIGEVVTVKDAMRILSYTLQELLPMGNGIARARTLISVALAFSKLVEVGEMETRLAAIETTLKTREAGR